MKEDSLSTVSREVLSLVTLTLTPCSSLSHSAPTTEMVCSIDITAAVDFSPLQV